MIDIDVGSNHLKANLYGAEVDSTTAGTIALMPSNNLTVAIAPGSPALRDAKLDLEITRVSLLYAGK